MGYVGRGGGHGRLIPAHRSSAPSFWSIGVGLTQRHQQAQVPRSSDSPPPATTAAAAPPGSPCSRPERRRTPAVAPRRPLGQPVPPSLRVLGEDRIPDRIPIRVGIHPPAAGHALAGRLVLPQQAIQGRHDALPHHRCRHPCRRVVHGHSVGVGPEPLQSLPGPRRHGRVVRKFVIDRGPAELVDGVQVARAGPCRRRAASSRSASFSAPPSADRFFAASRRPPPWPRHRPSALPRPGPAARHGLGVTRSPPRPARPRAGPLGSAAGGERSAQPAQRQ